MKSTQEKEEAGFCVVTRHLNNNEKNESKRLRPDPHCHDACTAICSLHHGSTDITENAAGISVFPIKIVIAEYLMFCRKGLSLWR